MKTIDTVQMAKQMDVNSFIAEVVAHQTRTVRGRELVNNMEVFRVKGGWFYSFHSLVPGLKATFRAGTNSVAPLSAESLVEMIRRTLLAYYVDRACADWCSYQA